MITGRPSVETNLAISQKIRKRNLTYAFFAGMVSKTLAIALQWIALPLSLNALGTNRYAAFLALQALVAWASLLAMGLVPSLPRFISAAVTANDTEKQRDIFQTALVYMTTICVLFAIAMLALGFLVSPSKMIGVHDVVSTEILHAYEAVILVTCLQLISGLVPSIRSGYQELHYSYGWAIAASCVVMTGLFHISAGKPTISVFLLVIYLPLTLFLLADAGLIALQRPYLLRGKAQFVKTARLLAPQASNAMVAQFSYFLVSFLPTLIVAHLSGATATAAFGSIMQALILACSGMNLIFQPMLPALANAYSQHDRVWLKKAYFRMASLVLAACGTGLLVDIFAGSYLLHKWLGDKLLIPPALPILLGIYFCLWMVSVMHFNVLAATGKLDRIGKAYLLEGTFAVTLGSCLTYFFGAAGMATALVTATACVTFWFLSLQVWRHVINETPDSEIIH